MAGPFTGYAPPGVYTKTKVEAGIAALAGDIRIPAFIGTAQEYKRAVNADMVRGSSSSRDNKRNGEDLSYQVNGINKSFTVQKFPIVTGAGSGTVSNTPSHIEVFVNSVKVVVNRLTGSTGTFVLQVAPAMGDTLTVNYYYKLTDTKVVDENVSVQIATGNKTFYTAFAPIVDGTDGGVLAVRTSDVIAKVNNSIVAISEINAADGYVILTSEPLATDTVTLTYYYNKYANTEDDLLYLNPIEIEKVGITPDSNEYIEGKSFVINGNQINWGTSFKVLPGVTSTGSVAFDDLQISGALTDNKIYKEDVSSQLTGSENFFTTKFFPLVDGSGKSVTTENPASVKVYVNGVEVEVTRIDGAIGKVYLKTIPAALDVVVVTYFRNTILNEAYTLECKLSGATGIGAYSILDQSGNSVLYPMQTSGPVDLEWLVQPRTALGTSVVETVTLTFSNATDFIVTSTNASGTASGTTTTGKVGTTFVDDITGFSFTISSGTFVLGTTVDIDIIDSVSTPIITNAVESIDCIQGVTFQVNNTTNIATGDTAIFTTYKNTDIEPAIGDLYYMTYKYEKTAADYLPKLFTRFVDVVNEYGPLSTDNPLTLAAYLAFQNGASAVMCKQVPRSAGLDTAADSSYIDALTFFERPVDGYDPYIMCPLTTSISVQQAVKNHVNIRSSMRYRQERVHVFGFATGTNINDAISVARSFKNDRSWCVYPDGGVVQLMDEFGTQTDYVVDGSFLAAALAGLCVSPLVDEATPMTRKTVVGIKGLIRDNSELEKDTLASSGIIVFESIPGAIRIRHALTTDLSNTFTRKPEIVTTKDAVQKAIRVALDPFIGQKILSNSFTNISLSVAATLRGMVQNTIIYAYDPNIIVDQDSTDPSFLRVTAYYQPIFGIDWIEATLNIRTQL